MLQLNGLISAIDIDSLCKAICLALSTKKFTGLWRPFYLLNVANWYFIQGNIINSYHTVGQRSVNCWYTVGRQLANSISTVSWQTFRGALLHFYRKKWWEFTGIYWDQAFESNRPLINSTKMTLKIDSRMFKSFLWTLARPTLPTRRS